MNPDKIKAMDDVFKSRFAEFEGSVSPTSQENIFKKLDQKIFEDAQRSAQKKATKPVIYKQLSFYYIAAALVAGIFVINFIINSFTYTSVDDADKNIAKVIPQKPAIAPAVQDVESPEPTKIQEAKPPASPVVAMEMVSINNSKEIQEVNLPDGSKIILNKNASLSYAKDFNKNRFIKFSGEAFFEVKRITTSPFTIEGQRSAITVLGTSFNVQFDSVTGVEKVEVVSGKVKFESLKASDYNLILTKGFSGTNNKGEKNLIKESIDNKNFIAWKDKNLVFVDAPLSQVFQDLEHCYGVNIEMPSPLLLKCSFTGNFKNESLDKVAKLIASTLDLELHQEAQTLVFTGKGCIE